MSNFKTTQPSSVGERGGMRGGSILAARAQISVRAKFERKASHTTTFLQGKWKTIETFI